MIGYVHARLINPSAQARVLNTSKIAVRTPMIFVQNIPISSRRHTGVRFNCVYSASQRNSHGDHTATPLRSLTPKDRRSRFHPRMHRVLTTSLRCTSASMVISLRSGPEHSKGTGPWRLLWACIGRSASLWSSLRPSAFSLRIHGANGDSTASWVAVGTQ